MKKLLLLLLLFSLSFSEFNFQSAEVTLSDINGDGSASVRESIKFSVSGTYERSLYQKGFTENELSYWATTTNLDEIKLHIDANKVNIRDFRVKPQPLKGCNVFLDMCQGELIIEYTTHPQIDKNTSEPVEGTGIFSVEKYKPRTYKYSINSEVLSFTTTEQGDIILDDRVYLIVKPPQPRSNTEVNPMPDDVDESQLDYAEQLVWEDIILVKFSLSFEVEESLDEEVMDFFTDLFRNAVATIEGEYGLAVIAIAGVLIGSYVYLKSKK